MKIFLDNIIYSLQSIGGISVYWNELLSSFSIKNIDFTVINCKGKNSNLYPKTINDYRLPIILKRSLPLLKKIPSKSLFHSSYLRISLQRDVCNIVTIHDLAAEKKKISGIRRLLKLILQGLAIRKADGIICVSEFTKQSLLDYYKFLNENNIKVIHHGCSEEFKRIGSPSEKIILYIGGRGVYKNFSICLQTLSTLPDYSLYMIGGGSLSKKEKQVLDSILKDRYKHFIEVSTEELNKLYNIAHCLLYPSKYEGFGMPVVEAMSAGCPIITTRIPAIEEISGGANILIEDYNNPKLFKEAILLLEDQNKRELYISKGLKRAKYFNWTLSSKETLDFYQNIYRKKFNLPSL